MSSEDKLEVFTLMMSVTDIFGEGGDQYFWDDQTSKLSCHFWSACFWHGRLSYIRLPARKPKAFLRHPLGTCEEVLIAAPCHRRTVGRIGILARHAMFASLSGPFCTTIII